jgi:hypothetical protein
LHQNLTQNALYNPLVNILETFLHMHIVCDVIVVVHKLTTNVDYKFTVLTGPKATQTNGFVHGSDNFQNVFT